MSNTWFEVNLGEDDRLGCETRSLEVCVRKEEEGEAGIDAFPERQTLLGPCSAQVMIQVVRLGVEAKDPGSI